MRWRTESRPEETIRTGKSGTTQDGAKGSGWRNGSFEDERQEPFGGHAEEEVSAFVSVGD